MRRLLLILALAALAAPASALAGGWATAGLTPPEGVAAGDTWNADVKILQHGQTPLAGVIPTVTIRNVATGKEKTFTAKPTGTVGVYRAKVVFPTDGKYSYKVYDGFTQYGGAQTHSFGTFSVGAGGDGGLPFFAIIGIAGLALGATALIYLLARRVRVRAPAPSH
jgi:YtkA-like protein